MGITRIFLDFGGGIFVLMGALHAIYTYADIRRPRRLVPQDPAVALAMADTQVRLSRGGTTMWRAWVGFNFSHSLGAVMFGSLCCCAGALLGTTSLPAWVLFLFVLIALIYLALSALYWFKIPTAGIAVATACLLTAWITYASTGP